MLSEALIISLVFAGGCASHATNGSAALRVGRSAAIEIAYKKALSLYPGRRIEVVNAEYSEGERLWDVLVNRLPVIPDSYSMIEVSASDGRIIRIFP
jgi:hypothetical protein